LLQSTPTTTATEKEEVGGGGEEARGNGKEGGQGSDATKEAEVATQM